jgi:dTDP-4-dehydrorhamnose 3,5-epimerase
MKIVKSKISGCFKIEPIIHRDYRGSFIKNYRSDFFEENSLDNNFCEDYYSESFKGVLRGMHFQLPPHDHNKMVSCISGDILDVIVDLRIDSPTYGMHDSFKINSENAEIVYICKGIAHGFYTLSQKALVYYKVSSLYEPHSDSGIKWDSIGYKWPSNNPIVSERDQSFSPMNDFQSPFKV